MRRVDGRVALITGGASGLGAAMALALAREGAMITITDVQAELGRSTASDIPGAVFLEQDVRDERRWAEVVDEVVATFGKLDILVNNAGVIRIADIEELGYADYKFQVDTMLDGTFLGCKHALPKMSRSGGGSIINVSSIGGIKGVASMPAYAAAKAGIISITRSVAIHCQDRNYGIRCNAIAPSGIATPMMDHVVSVLAPDDPSMTQTRNFGLGHPSDIALAVLYLASDESRFMTGATMVIDNGETIR